MASEKKIDTSTLHHCGRLSKASSPPLIDPLIKSSSNSPSSSHLQHSKIMISPLDKQPAKSIEKPAKLPKRNTENIGAEVPFHSKQKNIEHKDASTQDNLLAMTIFREDYEADFPEAIELRLVPLNLDVQKLMVLHGLNPRISTKCKLTLSLHKVIAQLKEHISKDQNIETIIGRKNEIKLAPDMEQIRDANRVVSKEDEENQEEKNVLVWSESSSEPIIVKDLFVALRKVSPIYLYYYWDAIPVPPAQSKESRPLHLESYYQQKGKEDLLESGEYEDFIDMVAKVVQNVIEKKRKKRRRNNKKTLEQSKPEENGEKSNELKREAPELSAVDNAFALIGRKSKTQPEELNALTCLENFPRISSQKQKESARRKLNFEESESQLFPDSKAEDSLGMNLHPPKEFSSRFNPS